MANKNGPIGKVVGRQLSAELPEECAPEKVIVDADNRLRRVDGTNTTPVSTITLWQEASKKIEDSLRDTQKDEQFHVGTQIALQLIGLRYGVDAMVPRAPRPNRAADIPVVVKVVMDNRGLLLDAVPNAATEGDLARMKEDNERLDFITRARANVRILDRGLEAVQTQCENRLAQPLDQIFTRSRSVINAHAGLQERLGPLVEYSVGAAEDAAATRKEREREAERAARAKAAAAPAAPATPPIVDDPQRKR